MERVSKRRAIRWNAYGCLIDGRESTQGSQERQRRGNVLNKSADMSSALLFEEINLNDLPLRTRFDDELDRTTAAGEQLHNKHDQRGKQEDVE
jgi:hypothetical protein